MYYPRLRAQYAERQACLKLNSLASDSCSPVVSFPPPKTESDSKLVLAEIRRWKDVSAILPEVGLVATPRTVDLIRDVLGSFYKGEGRLRVAGSVDVAQLHWDVFADYQRAFQRPSLVLLSPTDAFDRGCLSWLVSQRARYPLDVALVLGAIGDRTVYYRAAQSALDSLSKFGLEDVIVIGGSYPVDNTDMPTNTVNTLDRKEWLIFQALRPEWPGLRFGDFAVLSPKIRQGAAGAGNEHFPAFRYTDSDEWHVHRGKGITRDLWDITVQSLACEIVNSTYYAGDYFSWADERLLNIADGKCEPPHRWQEIRTIEINHHLTFVSRQTAQSGDDEAPPEVPLAARGA